MRHHIEQHRTDRIGWLRAAVLGANDGIVSTASLLVGVAVLPLAVAALAPMHFMIHWVSGTSLFFWPYWAPSRLVSAAPMF